MTHGATKMEDLNDKGLYLDELQKLRVIEPDAAEQVRFFLSFFLKNIELLKIIFKKKISFVGQGYEGRMWRTDATNRRFQKNDRSVYCINRTGGTQIF